MTLEELLISLRTRLLKAREDLDDRLLYELAATFGILGDAVAEKYEEHELIGIFLNLRLAAHDSLHKVPFKSEIPSEDKIREAARL